MVKPLAVVQTVEDTPQHCLSWKHSKAAVLNSLGSLQSRRSYKHAIEEFIRWYCSEGLALNRAVVLRYRLHLERIPLAPSTINVRLAAIRRIALEVTDTGLLSP